VKCGHTYLGLKIEDNGRWVAQLRGERRLCNARLSDACSGLITDTFYRCITCSFKYVCCAASYKEEMAGVKRKRTIKRKEY